MSRNAFSQFPNHPVNLTKPKASKPKLSVCQLRTQQILDYFKGMPDEFLLLKGLLIAQHPFNWADGKAIRTAYDGGMVATRMDAINAEVRALVLADMAAREAAKVTRIVTN